MKRVSGISKANVLITLEWAGVHQIKCDHCATAWPLQFVSKHLIDFRLIKINYDGDYFAGNGFTLIHKDHLKEGEINENAN